MNLRDFNVGDYFIADVNISSEQVRSIFVCAFCLDGKFKIVNLKDPVHTWTGFNEDHWKIVKKIDNPFNTETFNKLLEVMK